MTIKIMKGFFANLLRSIRIKNATIAGRREKKETAIGFSSIASSIFGSPGSSIETFIAFEIKNTIRFNTAAITPPIIPRSAMVPFLALLVSIIEIFWINID
jgi:hypothetical protein